MVVRWKLWGGGPAAPRWLEPDQANEGWLHALAPILTWWPHSRPPPFHLPWMANGQTPRQRSRTSLLALAEQYERPSEPLGPDSGAMWVNLRTWILNRVHEQPCSHLKELCRAADDFPRDRLERQVQRLVDQGALV